MLRVYSGKLIPLIELFVSEYITNKTKLGELNDYYSQLYRRITDILASSEFANYQKAFPELYDDLNIYPDDMARMWHFGKEQMLHFINLVEAVWKTEGHSKPDITLQLDVQTKHLLDKTDSLIIELSQYAEQQVSISRARHQSVNEAEELLKIWPWPVNDALSNIKLEASSYDAANGLLTIHGQQVFIIKQPNMKGPKNEKYPAKLMRALFAVNTFPAAIPIRHIYPVKTEKYPPPIVKRVNKLVAQINEAILEKVPAKDVIKHDNFKFYINSIYLK